MQYEHSIYSVSVPQLVDLIERIKSLSVCVCMTRDCRTQQ